MQNNYPLVSVIIAANNAEKTLSRCLDSILAQSYRNLEIIVINDASTDNTQDILNDYAARDNRIVLLSMKQNSGAPAARNEGMKITRGEFMTTIDADDRIDINTIELSVNELLADNELDLVTYDTIIVNTHTGVATPYKTNPQVPKVMNGREACYWSIQFDYSLLGMSRSPLEQNMPAKSEYGQHSDETVTQMICLRARKVKRGAGKYYYYMEPSSITHNISVKLFERIDGRMLLRKQFLEENLDKSFISRLDKKRWMELIEMCYLFHVNKSKLSFEEQVFIFNKLSDTYDSFHWRDLPLKIVLKPRFMMLPSFPLFYKQLSLVFKLNLFKI